MIAYISIVGGLVLLFLGGEALVRGAVSLASRLGVSKLVISLTVVALGTSAPELVVVLQAALEGAPGVAVGNVVGSNITNVLLILGVAAMIMPIVTESSAIARDGVAMVLASVVFIALACVGEFRAWSGAVLLILLIGYFGLRYWGDRREGAAAREHAREVDGMVADHLSLPLAALVTVAGLAVLVVGADLLVDGAVAVARAHGVSEAVIGLTLVAFGTSLPELATCAVAAWRKHPDVALGNVLGSNMFNLLGVMGAVALVTPVGVPQQIIHFDVWIMLAVSVLVLPLLMTGRRLGRVEALALTLLYFGYVAVQFLGVEGLVVPSAA
jgi:cation:H+ antiporter